MIITTSVINHYFPQAINSFKGEYFRLFDFEMQQGNNSPVKGWKYKYIGKEIPEDRVKLINEYFQKNIVPKLKGDSTPTLF